MFKSSGALSAFVKIVIALALAASASKAFAQSDRVGKDEGTPNEMPKQLENVGITEQMGAIVDPTIAFKDERGNDVTIGSYLGKNRPVLLSLAYYNCPGLCNFHLNGMVDALKEVSLKMGKDFEYIVVSFDEKETPELASQKKQSYLRSFGDSGAADGWHFLTGSAASIAALTKQVGFQFKWDEPSKEFAHASAAIMLSPEGKISRYLHGIHFEPKSVRLGLLEAAEGTVGTIVDRFLLYCFHYDPKQNKYAVAAMSVMRIAGAATVLVLALFIGPYWWRQRKDQKKDQRRAQKGAGLQGEQS